MNHLGPKPCALPNASTGSLRGAINCVRNPKGLKVVVLVPHSDVPCRRRPLTGKIVCERGRDDTSKVVCYEVRYVAMRYAHQYGIDYENFTAPPPFSSSSNDAS